jgi:DNA (cytosine-5)-methyltransferase 1
MQTSKTLLKESVVKVGERRGISRVWIEGKKLLMAGFSIGRSYEVDINEKSKIVTLRASHHGIADRERKVSKRKDTPIIDLCRKVLSSIFSDKACVKIFAGVIVITQPYHDIISERAKLMAREKPIAFEYFAGGGTLAKAIVDAGYEMALAVELESKFCENLEANLPKTLVLNESVSEICPMMLPSGADLFVAGVPCETYSMARRKPKGEHVGDYTDHDNMHLVYYVIEAIRTARPKNVLIEEVVGFKNSVQCVLLKGVLNDLGYHMSETIVAPINEVTSRKRYALVASLKEGYCFPSFDDQPPRSLSEILFSSKPERDYWPEDNATMKREFARLEVHAQRNNGFGFKAITPETTKLPTITKDYTKFRS